MARRTTRNSPAPTTPSKPSDPWKIASPIVLVAACLAFFWTPLTSPQTSILWDAADYYYVVQKYFSEEILAGRMPFWTPYIWSGYPFLADPQVGAWYPLNWPFFLLGVGPKTIFAENFLHSLGACFGAYFLALRLLRNRPAALFAGLCYGLSGYFVGHSSHTTMLQAAAWMPWLLLAFHYALHERKAKYIALAVLAAGILIVAGHFQTTLYSFLALGLFAIAQAIVQPPLAIRSLTLGLAIPAGGTILSAVHTLPGLELVANSIRSSLEAVTRTEGFLRPGSLVTLFYPDYYGVLSSAYKGPADITQFYLYAGVLLVPLAVLGYRQRAVLWAGLLLTVVPVWYALGHPGGLYYLMARLPAFSSVRAPINVWFVPSLGLALLAASGFVWITEKARQPWLPIALLVFTAGDLWYFNSEKNPILYARTDYDTLYGAGENLFERAIGVSQQPLTRFTWPNRQKQFGGFSHPLEARVEATYGYGPLVLAAYEDFTTAAKTNPKLRNDLNVSRFMENRDGQLKLQSNPDALARVNFPKSVQRVANLDESRRLLTQLDPAEQAIIPATAPQFQQDAAATAKVLEHSPGRYRIRYRATTDSLLRIAVSYFPGWQARIDGRKLEVLRADHALMGVAVPAGEKELLLEYHSTYFPLGAAISLLGVAACAFVAFRQGTS